MSRDRLNLGASAGEPQAIRIVDGPVKESRDRVIDNLLAEAREDGFRQGTISAQEQAAGALEKAVDHLESFCEEASTSLSTAAVELAVEIARHLLLIEIDAGHYELERIVRETLRASGIGRAGCVVRLNPIDAQALEGVPFRAGTKIEADVGIPRGDVQIETPNGIFVRDLDDTLSSIRDRIREDLRG